MVYLHVAQAASLRAEGSARGCCSVVEVAVRSKVAGDGEAPARARTCMQETHTPLWNEVLQLPGLLPSSEFIVMLHVCGHDESGESYIEKSYYVELAIPEDIELGYCEEWVELKCRSSECPDCTSSGLRECIRLRIAYSQSLEVVNLVRGCVYPSEVNSGGQWMTIKPRSFVKSVVGPEKSTETCPIFITGRDAPPKFPRFMKLVH
mmetsp:Transcript_36090/g.94917  ORF Transcript_36090/g.94917 Transcript_36090/m.94917 type:complete len:206 (-) Transcript_36090:43-660(-)